MINPKLFNFFGWNPTGDFGPWTIYTAKNGKPVMFIKAPPKTPPTERQIFQRDTFRFTAKKWSLHTQAFRDLWELAAKRAHLFLTGYNLYLWYQSSQDTRALETIIQQSGVEIPH